MKTDLAKFRKLAAYGVPGFLFAQALQASTLLQFGGTSNIGANAGNPPMDESYGDNVTAGNPVTGIVATAGPSGVSGTPDISLAYNPNIGGGIFDSYPGWEGRGGVAVLQVQFDASTTMDIEFTPTGDVGALISSFDLDEWSGGGNSIIHWSIVNGENVIVSGTWDQFGDALGGNGGRTTINTGMTYAQAMANAGAKLALKLNLASGAGSYQALDNLAFDQVPAFKITSHSKSGNQISLTWNSDPTGAGTTYRIESSTDLGNSDPWTTVAGQESIPSAGATTTRTFTSTGERRFFRVVQP